MVSFWPFFSSSKKGGSFGGMFGMLKGLVGSKSLTHEDMESVLDKMREHLIGMPFHLHFVIVSRLGWPPAPILSFSLPFFVVFFPFSKECSSWHCCPAVWLCCQKTRGQSHGHIRQWVHFNHFRTVFHPINAAIHSFIFSFLSVLICC